MRGKLAFLEKRVTPRKNEAIWLVPHFYLRGTPKPAFPSEEEQLAQARARMETHIVVTVAVECP